MPTTPHDRQLARTALDALYASTGVQGRLVPLGVRAASDASRADIAIELKLEDSRQTFYAECKTLIDRASVLAQIKHRLEHVKKPGVLVSPYLTAQMADHCRAIGLNFIDTAGNAYLTAPGLYLFVKGQKAPALTHTAGSRTSANTSALRMIFALLADPQLMHAPYRDIVNATGIALGAVGPVFQDLEKRGLITAADKQHGHRLLEPARLLDEWAANYPIKLRHKLHAHRFHAPDPHWWQALKPVELNAWWSGEIAADRMTGELKPATQTLYVAPDTMQGSLRILVTQHRLRPDPQGTIEILDSFWNIPRNKRQPELAPPALVYADLMASLDSRNLEVAKTIREKALADA